MASVAQDSNGPISDPRTHRKRRHIAGRFAVCGVAIAIVAGACAFGGAAATPPTSPTPDTSFSPSASVIPSASLEPSPYPSTSPDSSGPPTLVTPHPTIAQLPRSSWSLVSGVFPRQTPTGYNTYGILVAATSRGFLAFLPVASEGVRVYQSQDGLSWTQRAGLSEAYATVKGLAESKGTIVVVGSTRRGPGLLGLDTAVAWTTSDLVTWRAFQLSPPDGTALWSVAAGPAGFVAAGNDFSGVAFWASTDGIEWHRLVPAGLPSEGLGASSGDFFAVPGGYGLIANPAQLWVSEDGNAWTRTWVAPATASQTEQYYLGQIFKAPNGGYLAFGGLYIGTGVASLTPGDILLWTSRDMTHWTLSETVKAPGLIDGFASVAGGFVAAGSEPHDASGGVTEWAQLNLWSSSDGRSWQAVPSLSSLDRIQVLAVAGDGSRVVVLVVNDQGDLEILTGPGTS